MKNPWKTVKKNIVYENKKYGYILREDDIITPSGNAGKYTVFENRGGYAAIVPLSKDRQLYLVRQWRYPIEEESLELPAGTIDRAGTPLETAQRELFEEIGGSSKNWIFLGDHWLGNGVLRIKGYVYLAKDVEISAANCTEGDEEMVVEKMDFKTALQNLKKGMFADERTQLGILLANEYLRDN